jgi:hypothetical protein
MTITPAAFKRLMDRPETDTAFVVCIGKERIYAGSVWSDILSSSFGGIVILKREEGEKSAETWANEHTIHFDLGYPSEKYFTEKDLRDDPRIIHALEKKAKSN